MLQCSGFALPTIIKYSRLLDGWIFLFINHIFIEIEREGLDLENGREAKAGRRSVAEAEKKREARAVRGREAEVGRKSEAGVGIGFGETGRLLYK